jgi:hypothetical protein
VSSASKLPVGNKSRILFHRAVLLRWFAIHALRASRKAESGTVAGRRARPWRVEWYGVGHSGNGTRPIQEERPPLARSPGLISLSCPGRKSWSCGRCSLYPRTRRLFRGRRHRAGVFRPRTPIQSCCATAPAGRPRCRRRFRLQWTGFLTDKPLQYGTRRVATLFCADCGHWR